MYVSSDEYAAYVIKNPGKYLPKFLRFEDLGGSFSVTWHWPAFFFTFWWFLYRKMYVWAVIFFLAWFFGTPHFWWLGHLAAGITAYYLYFLQARSQIGAIKRNNYGDVRLRCMELGGVNPWVPLVGLICSTMFFVGLIAFIFFGLFWAFFHFLGLGSVTIYHI